MGLRDYGGIVVLGNFEKRQESKPKDFDYMSDAKWYEDYPFECREMIGKTECDCKKVKVNYAPYYGFDYYHDDNCALMLRIQERPGLTNLPAFTYLPSIYAHSTPKCNHPKEES